MKIVIDISENLYKANINGLNAKEIWDLRVALKNGTPLDDIKAEIQEHTQRYTLARESGGMGQVDWSDYLIKADDVIKLIDKHISGKDNVKVKGEEE